MHTHARTHADRLCLVRQCWTLSSDSSPPNPAPKKLNTLLRGASKPSVTSEPSSRVCQPSQLSSSNQISTHVSQSTQSKLAGVLTRPSSIPPLATPAYGCMRIRPVLHLSGYRFHRFALDDLSLQLSFSPYKRPAVGIHGRESSNGSVGRSPSVAEAAVIKPLILNPVFALDACDSAISSAYLG